MAGKMCFTSFWMMLFLIAGTAASSFGQDTLPSFSAHLVVEKKARLSWVNPYGEKVKQINIQRSRDSLQNFKTIGSITHPTLDKNEFTDKSPNSQYFYRLYILLDGGRYVFSLSRKAGNYSVPPPVQLTRINQDLPAKPGNPNTETHGLPKEKISTPVNPPKNPEKRVQPVVPEEKSWTVKKGTEIIGKLKFSAFKNFRDSLVQNTRDTLGSITNDTIYIRPFQVKEVYKPSRLVFLDKNGLLHLEMPDPGRKNYHVKFYEEDKSFLFEVKAIRDPLLLLEKSNFGHAGWFLFEVFEDGRLIEKNRVFLNRDF